jgi:hypothetical protein
MMPLMMSTYEEGIPQPACASEMVSEVLLMVHVRYPRYRQLPYLVYHTHTLSHKYEFTSEAKAGWSIPNA